MRTNTALKTLTAMAAGLLLAACTSNGNDGGDITGGNGATGGPANDGTGGTSITDGGKPVTGHFVCTRGASGYNDVTTAVGSNGLVGGPLTVLLNTLGGTSATKLLNSVTEPNNVIDGDLNTFSTFTLTAGLITGLLDSVDESVLIPGTVPAGHYAVFGLSFPNGTANLSLLNSVSVTTYLNNVQQEQNTLNQTLLLGLLNQGVLTSPAVWLGVKTEKAYDRATVSLSPGVLSADVGDAMHVYELCTDGTLN
ncbi:MAG TPA: hypothetical protein VFA75_14855 [Nevskia sp.]|nr:hypothetical protein [Nevskia sp.]